MTPRIRRRQPRYTVTMGLNPWAHNWLRDEATKLTGDDRFISKVIEGLVRDRIERQKQRPVETLE